MYYGGEQIKIAYHKDKLIFASGLLVSFNWKYLKSITVNGKTYEPGAVGIVVPKKTQVEWSVEPLKYCEIDTYSGSFQIENHTEIGSTGRVVPPLPLDILFINKESGEYLLTNDITRDVEKNYRPIGIAVVPAAHNVYGDGSVAIAGLDVLQGQMFDTLEHWDWALNLGQWNIIANKGGTNTVSNKVTGMNGDSILPTTKEDSKFSIKSYNSNEKYSSEKNEAFSPSPYLADGSRNPSYYQTSSPASENNGFANFIGRERTNSIYSLGEGRSEIVNKVMNYSTFGTKKGDWYIPSIGGIGYFAVRIQEYVDIANILYGLYDLKRYKGIENNQYWTSNEWGFRNEATGYNMATCSMTDAYLTKKDKLQNLFSIPFMHYTPK